MFGPMIWELLNIEQFRKKEKEGKLVYFFILFENIQWVGFCGGDFIILNPKVQDILNNTWKFHRNEFFKFNQLGNEYTLGLAMTHATLFQTY